MHKNNLRCNIGEKNTNNLQARAKLLSDLNKRGFCQQCHEYRDVPIYLACFGVSRNFEGRKKNSQHRCKVIVGAEAETEEIWGSSSREKAILLGDGFGVRRILASTLEVFDDSQTRIPGMAREKNTFPRVYHARRETSALRGTYSPFLASIAACSFSAKVSSTL